MEELQSQELEELVQELEGENGRGFRLGCKTPKEGTMAKKITHGLELSKQSWSALRQNRQLVVFPIISGLGMVVVTILFFIPEALAVRPILETPEPSTVQWIVALAILFVYYLVASFVVTFSNTALVGATLKLIDGQPATVGDGIGIAMSRLGKILAYSLISATVGVIARSIFRAGRQSDNILVTIVSAIFGAALQAAWSILVFFAIPVMVVEDLSVPESLKRSFELFKRTWGEGFVGSTAIGGISCLVYLAVVLVCGGIVAAGLLTGALALVILGVVLLVLGVIAVSLLNSAVNGIFQASMYRFATSGNAGLFIDSELARQAFQA